MSDQDKNRLNLVLTDPAGGLRLSYTDWTFMVLDDSKAVVDYQLSTVKTNLGVVRYADLPDHLHLLASQNGTNGVNP